MVTNNQITIAALFVESNGCYFGLDNVEPWDHCMDARKYSGPHPVVAHPPCARWGTYWGGGPDNHGTSKQKHLGDDDGCFDSALASVRKWGGVLEHPKGSHAWRVNHLNTPPRCGGWVNADMYGGWTCCVEQGAYGHPSRKPTWLYAYGVELPSLKWGKADGIFNPIDNIYIPDSVRKKIIKRGIVERLSKRQRAATPLQFRDLLIAIARTANQKDQAQ